MQETGVQSLRGEDTLEKEMATHSSTLAWRIPWTKKPGRLQSTGWQTVRYDWATLSLTGLFFLLQDQLSSVIQNASMADCKWWGWDTAQSSLLSWNSQSHADTHMQNRGNKMAPVICCMVHTTYAKSDFSSFSHHPVWGQLLWSSLCFQDHPGRDTRQETSVSIWLMITPRAEALNAMPRFMRVSPETRAKTASESSDFISRALFPSPGLPPTDLSRSEKDRQRWCPWRKREI